METRLQLDEKGDRILYRSPGNKVYGNKNMSHTTFVVARRVTSTNVCVCGHVVTHRTHGDKTDLWIDNREVYPGLDVYVYIS